MKTMKLVLGFIFSALLLSACGGGGGEGCNDENSGFFIDIKCFTLSTTTLDPNINNGKFTAVWEFTTNNTDPDDDVLNVVNFYVSKDKKYDFGEDLEIYYDFNANETRSVPCSFGADNVMRCGTSLIRPMDLTAWLASLPSDAYILARACFGLSCDTESILVNFQ